jgi:predicted RNase H-like HicB family nuclease
VPDLPGCSAFVEAPKAAVWEIGDAIEAWIAAAAPPATRSPSLRTKARQAA